MGERVLVVDDDEVVLKAVQKALGPDDFEIDTVQSAGEAVKLLATSSYNLVITDLMMSGMDGLQLLQRIRDMGVKTSAVMITGYPTIQTALYAKRLGAFEYVTKPFTRQELRSVVIRAIRAGAADRVASEPLPASGPRGPVYYIPDHAWASIEPDGKVRVGMARAFALAVGEVAGFQLPAKDALVEQGRACAVVLAADGVEHSLYSPLSGWVLEVNPAVLEHPALAGSDPEHLGWLLRLVPQALDREIPNLSPA